MTKSPPTLVVDSIMLGPALMLINQYLSAPVPEQFLLWLVMVSSVCVSVCLCVYLSVCLSVCVSISVSVCLFEIRIHG